MWSSPAAVLVEAVGGDRPQRDQRTAHVVDDTTEQKRQLVAGRLVGVVGHLKQNRPTEDALVELSGPLDVADGEPHMRDGIGGDAHPSHGATAQPACIHRLHARIAVVQISMTMPVMEPDLDAAVLRDWARAIDDGPFASLCWGERMAFDNPETLTLMGALAAWTDRVRLVTTVIVPAAARPGHVGQGGGH